MTSTWLVREMWTQSSGKINIQVQSYTHIYYLISSQWFHTLFWDGG